MAHKFKGTGVALITPFLQDGSVDFPALQQLVDDVIAGGVDYLVALGTTSEGPTLSADEKQLVLQTIIQQCNKRVPVVCGVGGNNTAQLVHQLQHADMSGIDGILSVAPYYNKPTQEGIYQHFKAIAQATALPIILYNVPGRTASNILPATALKLANEFAHIIAIKEASGNLGQCMELVKNAPAHFAILSGDDDLVLAQIALGMQGVISVAANCFTRDFCHMVNHALMNNYDAARALHYKLLDGVGLLFCEGNPAGVKCVLHNMKRCHNVLRLPLVPVSQTTALKVAAFVAAL
jgi:4-hydroxy-tetrahydrodipicolinate synthase